jgi:6-phospho-beta-glucosidase
LRARATRGEELQRLNRELFDQIEKSNSAETLQTYRNYLRCRNASYMKLETEAGSAFETAQSKEDPFETATGYHRIALEVLTGLLSQRAHEVVVNVPNRGGIEDLESDDVVEVPCEIDHNGASPHATGRLPASVRGLVQAVKAYERTLICAALSGSRTLARLAMLEYPIIGQWEVATEVLHSLIEKDSQTLGYLR